MSTPPHLRRRWRRQALLVGVLAAVGAVFAAVAAGSTLLGALALAFFCVAGVLGALLVFYEIGRSEDRARDSEAEADQGARRSSRHSSRSRR
jgi:heme A synthase